MAKKKLGEIELDDFHYHEMTDRLYMIMDIIDDHIQQHPVAKIETDLSRLIDEAHNKLWEAYQLVANKY